MSPVEPEPRRAAGSPRDAGPGGGDDEDGLLDLYVDGLRRSQLQLAGVALAGLLGLVATLPLLALVVPAIDGATIGQVPLIALLPLLPFPAFVLVGLLQSRRAEGLDRAFRDLVEPEDRDDDRP